MLLPCRKIFWKTKSPCLIFCKIFEEKYFSCHILLRNWPNFIVWLLLLREILDNMCILIASYAGCDVRNFEINLMFLIKPFFQQKHKVKTKIKGTRTIPTRKIPTWKTPTRTTPPRIIPTRKISTQENFHLENSHPKNSHLGDSRKKIPN